ncbi:MAG: dihydrofolate reductase family protein, partial [Candidatus Dormibacteraeota bacterium]|nr:dihydrofolate reductase family protein [Candidatus Dormibacteraeota bacterium]
SVPAAPTPPDLAEIYGGEIGFKTPAVYSNFVESLDGVVALEARQSSGSVISGHQDGDRFLMALLRACADAVLLGAGTLRATPNHRWTPEAAYPDLAASFAELRRMRGLAPEPRLVLVTRHGEIDPDHPAIQAGALVLTTMGNADRLRAELPASCEVWIAGVEAVDLGMAVGRLHHQGMNTILTEGGPHVIGELLGAGRLDEVFVTLAPVVAGRDGAGRLGMVEGAALLPDRTVGAGLTGVRRQDDYLFLRYRLSDAETR